MRRALAACFFLSGLAGLVYQVVWLRWLILLFGATTLAVSTVLTAFMGGLAIGSWVAGRQAHRVTRPLRAYGLLELAIGSYALVLPGLLAVAEPWLARLATPSFAVQSVGRFVLATGLLVVPTACMGATLPLLAQWVGRRLDGLGQEVGRLYAVNTLGAVVGTAITGFWLLPGIGVWRTNLLGAVVNGIVGVAGLLLDRRTLVEPAPPGVPVAVGPASPPEGPDLGPGGRRLLLVVVGGSGAAALLYEVAWSRALGLVLGSSVYAFTVMLTTFLVGLAVGSAVMARVVDRLPERGIALGLLQLYVALGTFLGILVTPELPYAFLALFRWTGQAHGWLLLAKFLVAGSVLLVPTLALGAVFPLAVRLTVGSLDRIGRTVGAVYAVNTMGAILGAFLAGFVLIPGLGIRGTLLAGLGLNLALALLALLGGPGRRRRLAILAAGLVVVAGAGVAVVVPRWNPLLMASGVAVYAPSYQKMDRQAFLRTFESGPRLLYHREGLSTSVAVTSAADGLYTLRVNGKADASTGADDMLTQSLLGHLPLLLAPEARRVLVIGLGSGVTAGAAGRHPIERLTIVEIEGVIREATRFFEAVNHRPLQDPRTSLVVNDGRNFLLTTSDRFDVIVSEPSNPWMSGVASLFTADFFRLARTRLTPDGVFCQWLQLYGMDPAMLRTALGSFGAVFPHVVAFQAAPQDLLLLGSPAPLRLDAIRRASWTDRAPVAADLGRLGIAGPADLLARFVGDGPSLAQLAAGAPINTDDNALIEFAAPRTLYSVTGSANRNALAEHFPGFDSVLASPLSPDELAAVGERQLAWGRTREATVVARQAMARGRGPEPHRLLGQILLGRYEEAEGLSQLHQALADDPAHLLTWLLLARHHLDRGAPAAAREAAQAARRHHPSSETAAALEGQALYELGAFRESLTVLGGIQDREPEAAATAHLYRGLAQWRLGDPAARATLAAHVAAHPEEPLGRLALGVLEFARGAVGEAMQEWARGAEIRARVAAGLGTRAQADLDRGDLVAAVGRLRAARRLDPANRVVSEALARGLEGQGHLAEAIVEWEAMLAGEPATLEAHRHLARLWRQSGDPDRARQHLARYLAAEHDPRRVAEARRELATLP